MKTTVPESKQRILKKRTHYIKNKMNNFTNTRVVTVKNKKKKGNKEKLCVESITVIKVQSSI